MSGHSVGGPWTLPEWLTMTQPRLAHQTPHGRMYARSLSGLPEVPSITTVIGMEKTDLDGWVGWMAAQSVTQDPRLAESVGSAARLKQVTDRLVKGTS